MPMSYKKVLNSLKRRASIIFPHAKNWKTIYIFILLSIIAPLFIHFLYSIPTINNWWSSKWSSDTALTYIGSVLSAIGTLYLGYVTLRQTEYINRMTLKNEKANTKRPFFIITGVYADMDKKTDVYHNGTSYSLAGPQVSCCYVLLKNIGDGPALNLTLDPRINSFGKPRVIDENEGGLCLSPNEQLSICLVLPFSTDLEEEIHYTIQYENILGTRYRQYINTKMCNFEESNCAITDDGDILDDSMQIYQRRSIEIMGISAQNEMPEKVTSDIDDKNQRNNNGL